MNDFNSECTYGNFVKLINKAGPLLSWPFLFPSEHSGVIPKVGPDFYQCAKALAGTDEDIVIDSYSDMLYFKALYQQGFSLPVSLNGNIINANFVPGCGWMDNCRVGPLENTST